MAKAKVYLFFNKLQPLAKSVPLTHLHKTLARVSSLERLTYIRLIFSNEFDKLRKQKKENIDYFSITTMLITRYPSAQNLKNFS